MNHNIINAEFAKICLSTLLAIFFASGTTTASAQAQTSSPASKPIPRTLTPGPLDPATNEKIRASLLAHFASQTKGKTSAYISVKKGQVIEISIEGHTCKAFAYRAFGVFFIKGQWGLDRYYLKTVSAWQVSDQSVIPTGLLIKLEKHKCELLDASAEANEISTSTKPKRPIKRKLPETAQKKTAATKSKKSNSRKRSKASKKSSDTSSDSES